MEKIDAQNGHKVQLIYALNQVIQESNHPKSTGDYRAYVG